MMSTEPPGKQTLCILVDLSVSTVIRLSRLSSYWLFLAISVWRRERVSASVLVRRLLACWPERMASLRLFSRSSAWAASTASASSLAVTSAASVRLAPRRFCSSAMAASSYAMRDTNDGRGQIRAGWRIRMDLHYFESWIRIRIHIRVKSWIRIRIEVKSWIRIHSKVMRTPGFGYGDFNN
jgi:hypothetical protein